MAHVLLEGGSVIDGTGAPPQAASVLIVGDRIAAVGAEADARVDTFADVERVDVTGCTILPGLVDTHVHISLGEPHSNDELFSHREVETASMLAAFNVRKLLLAGVTTFLDADGLWNIGPALRDAIEAGAVEGPRMQAGGNALMTAVGGTAGRFIPDSGTAGYAQVVRNRDEMVQVTRRQIKNGADWIKIHVTGRVQGHPGELSVWTIDELRAVCDTAHDLHTRVIAHCRDATSTRDAARAGVDVIYHAAFMDQEALDAVVEHGAALCPTFTFVANLIDYGAKVGTSAAYLEPFREELEATAGIVRAAYDAGVPLVCGSESGFSLTPYGHWHAREIELFVEHLGLTPLDAITCGTATGAAVMGLGDETGRIAPALAADVLVVEGDPLADVARLGDRRTFRHLYARGVEVDLASPWPERRLLPGERVTPMTNELLRWELVHP